MPYLSWSSIYSLHFKTSFRIWKQFLLKKTEGKKNALWIRDGAEHWTGSHTRRHLLGGCFLNSLCDLEQVMESLWVLFSWMRRKDFVLNAMTLNFAFFHVLELHNLLSVAGCILLAGSWSTLWINLRYLKIPSRPLVTWDACELNLCHLWVDMALSPNEPRLGR